LKSEVETMTMRNRQVRPRRPSRRATKPVAGALVVVRSDEARVREAFPGLHRQVLAFNENILGAKHQMRAGAVFPLHEHPQDQFAYLVSGRIRVFCEGKDFEARAGDSFVIRGGTKHEVHTLEDSVALDIFAPMREDYAKLGRMDRRRR
jgi:quercetin dioxygenase-like cupin family protein